MKLSKKKNIENNKERLDSPSYINGKKVKLKTLKECGLDNFISIRKLPRKELSKKFDLSKRNMFNGGNYYILMI